MRRWTDKELLRMLHVFYEENGRVPTTRELVGDYPNASTYRTRFGGVIQALGLAGLPTTDVVRRPYKYTDKELFGFIHQAADILGRVPIYTDFMKKGRFTSFPHVKTFEGRFGNFQTALKESGVLEKSFQEHIDKTLEKGERRMSEKLKPGSFKNVTEGQIVMEVAGKPRVIESKEVVKLALEDLEQIVNSEIITHGLLLPTKDPVTMNEAFAANFFTDEAIHRVVDESADAEGLRAILADVTSMNTANRFLIILKEKDAPASYITVAEERLEALQTQEIPD